jgi:hypothetical protein
MYGVFWFHQLPFSGHCALPLCGCDAADLRMFCVRCDAVMSALYLLCGRCARTMFNNMAARWLTYVCNTYSRLCCRNVALRLCIVAPLFANLCSGSGAAAIMQQQASQH